MELKGLSCEDGHIIQTMHTFSYIVGIVPNALELGEKARIVAPYCMHMNVCTESTHIK